MRHILIAPLSALKHLVAEISLPIEPVSAGVAIKLFRLGKHPQPFPAFPIWDVPSLPAGHWLLLRPC